MLLRHGIALSFIVLVLMACAAPPLPVTPAPNVPGAANTQIPIPTPVVVSTVALPGPSASALPSGTATGSPTAQATLVSNNLPTSTSVVSTTATATKTLTRTLTRTRTAVIAASPTLRATTVVTASPTISASFAITPTATISAALAITPTATLSVTRVPTVRATAQPKPTTAPAGPATLTQLFSGQRVTAMYVSADGTIYYGVAPSDESLQFPAQTVFQLWKWSPGSAPIALTPPTMRLIGGVLVHAGTIYFNEQGNLRRMPDNNQSQEGEIVIQFPAYLNNRNLPYGHMNSALATYNLNGREVLLMSMGSVLDSAYPAAGAPQSVFPPYYEDFPTGRINYATFDWLEQQHGYVATHGIANEYDEFARGVRNPWGMTVATVNGQTHILAVDNDPSFTPEKYDNNPANSGDELNDIVQTGNYGHPYFYGGGQPIVNFDDTSVPSGVAVAAGKVFVSMQVANQVVKVDLVKHTYTTVLENVLPFNLFAVGNLLYIANFDGIHVIDARGL